jgi:hypothetical protein
MKKLIVLFTLIFALVSVSAFADVQLNRSNVWRAKQHFNFGFKDDVARYMQIPLTGFTVSGVTVTSTTAPGTEVDDLIPNIVWADGETTPAQFTFRVPADYHSSGCFKLFVSESDSTTPNQVDFNVYVNKGDNTTAVATMESDETPVTMVGTIPETITLTPATAFTVILPGDWVTFNVWRDNVINGTGDLELKGIVFEYK